MVPYHARCLGGVGAAYGAGNGKAPSGNSLFAPAISRQSALALRIAHPATATVG